MKFFVAFALIAAVASAAVIKPVQVNGRLSEIQQIIDAIQSPSTNPATAAALEQMLEDFLGPSPISVGPAIVEGVSPIAVGPAIVDGVSPISVGPAIIEAGDIAVGPAIIDFPLPDGGAVSAPVEVSPVDSVVVGPAAASESSPLVQIIINVKAPAGAAPGAVAEPVEVIDQVPEPVQIVDSVAEPIQVVDTPIVVDPVQVVDVAPVAIGTPVLPTPVIPSPAITLPEELN
ncbi:cytadherence high molecular weight protein 3 [Manduca sexta]|uniref:cytadherence high molecular weight protein 3 n=1 Tax=Manduca sexta TaxID=7130 RepID=UPI001183DE1D|nr:cytadherence high molecular weight protein 3 [Manduca sexta]